MPAFRALLTQLCSEYERVESALADALAELQVRRGRDVRQGTFETISLSGGRPDGVLGWQDEQTAKGSRSYSPYAATGMQDSVAEEGKVEEEEEGQREVCKRGRTWSLQLTPRPVEERLTVEGPGLTDSPVATSNIISRGASGAPALAPILVGRAPAERSVAHESHCRRHSARCFPRLSPTPPLTRGSSDGVMRCQGTPASMCTQGSWPTCVNTKETPMRSVSFSAHEHLTSLPQVQGGTARMSLGCPQVVPGAGAERAELRLIPLLCSSWKSYMEDVRPVRPFQMPSRWVINPELSAALEKWDLMTMVALAFVALVTPVQVAMMETKLDVMFFVNCVIDFIFFWDMVLQFFLMYPQQTTGVYSLEQRHSKIIAHYLKSWFAIDILSIVPFDLFAVLSNSQEVNQLKIVKAVRLMRLLKLMRVLKASRVFQRFESRMSITYRRLALVKFFVILYVITHWLANLWALTLVIVDESEGVPRWVDALTELEANVDIKTKDSPAKLYIACLYFTSYTITSVGYGDISPQNIAERIVLSFIVIVSGVSWAVVLGQVCGIVVSLDKDEQAFRSTMDELNLMMQDRLIPRPMRTRLRSFFLSNKTAHKKALNLKIVSAMSPGLRAEVSWEINRMWLNKVNFLRPLLKEDPEFIAFRPFVFDMSLMMEQVVFAQGEAFGVPHTMYILNRGLVNRLNRLFRLGSVWGSDFVLSDRRLLEPVDAYALTYVELTTLTREHFFGLVQRHSMSFPEIYRTVRRYCCWLAFQRALLLEARRRRGLLQGKINDMMSPMPSVSGATPLSLSPAPPLAPESPRQAGLAATDSVALRASPDTAARGASEEFKGGAQNSRASPHSWAPAGTPTRRSQASSCTGLEMFVGYRSEKL